MAKMLRRNVPILKRMLKSWYVEFISKLGILINFYLPIAAE